MVKIGIIGGSGLEDPKILQDRKEVERETVYGKPSSALMTGKIKGFEVVMLLRHGKGHTIMPTNVPFRANIRVLKDAGCTHILATTACGSLRESIKPGNFIFIDQFIDRTTKRRSTFYEKDVVCHIPMAEPFCPNLRKLLFEQAKNLGLRYHEGGTVVTIEGPRFSTRAESFMFRQWGGDVINMSTVPEVVLAREAGLHYAAIAMPTDYDCWKMSEEAVDVSMVIKTFKENVEKVQRLLLETIPKIQPYDDCRCAKDIKAAIMTG
ncbi:MAG: S-methyl-5'-thioadenosine phosphorylase [Candidatus Bathyarchaeota archaeon]|nr:S-methyl-5'-thioadenosine phosphorylase [Candidatus Bathyarchaeota archaeon]